MPDPYVQGGFYETLIVGYILGIAILCLGGWLLTKIGGKK